MGSLRASESTSGAAGRVVDREAPVACMRSKLFSRSLCNAGASESEQELTMDRNFWKRRQQTRRAWRVRRRVRGNEERPRLSVYRTLKNISAQIIDDETGRTLVAASTLSADVKGSLDGGKGSNRAAATVVGKTLADRAKAAGISKVAFDRGGYKYHGRVAALADAAREGGLEF